MGRKLFIIAGLLVAVIIVGIMAFVDPTPERQEILTPSGQLSSGITPDEGNAALPPTIATPLPAIPVQTPEPTAEATPSPAPEPTPTPSPPPQTERTTTSPSPSSAPPAPTVATISPIPIATPVPTAKLSGKPLFGIVIGVDPGHQKKSNSEQEPVSPGSSQTKSKVSSGTYGRFTGTPEHEVVLNVGLYLQEMLKSAGATVIMTRETADVNISNIQRAQLFNENKVALGVRLHCNGSNDPKVDGAFMLIPKSHPYKSDCELAAKLVLDSYGKVTGIGVKKGITVRSDQTGFNWCERAIINIEMGHMTNEAEDHKLSDKTFQKSMAQGVFEGILRYFEQKQ